MSSVKYALIAKRIFICGFKCRVSAEQHFTNKKTFLVNGKYTIFEKKIKQKQGWFAY